MKKILVVMFFILLSQNSALARTEWTFEKYPNGMPLLMGTFDPSGLAIMFTCQDNDLFAGIAIVNSGNNINSIDDSDLTITSHDKQEATFRAKLIAQRNGMYFFLNPDPVSSIVAFHFLDISNGKDIQLRTDNNSLSVHKTSKIETTNAEKDIKKFKASCSILNNQIQN